MNSEVQCNEVFEKFGKSDTHVVNWKLRHSQRSQNGKRVGEYRVDQRAVRFIRYMEIMDEYRTIMAGATCRRMRSTKFQL